MQDSGSSNGVQLPVTQSSENAADLALCTYSVHHDLMKEAFADLLQLRACKAKYRTPYLIRNFIEASIIVERHQVDCCKNDCVAFTHTRSEMMVFGACGAARYAASGQRARQIAYWHVTRWLLSMLGDPIVGPDIMDGMKRARQAAAA